MSAIQNPIERVIEYHEQNCNGGVNSPCNLSQDARAELAQLRARIDALENDIVCALLVLETERWARR